MVQPGSCAVKAGRPEAAKAYGEALRLRSHDAELQINLGIAYQESGDRAKAKESYQRTLELNPSSITALWNLAIALEQDVNSTEAEKLHSCKDWPEALLNAGIAILEARRDAAHDALQRCPAAQPDFDEAGRSLAAIALERGRTDEALD
jgi:Tfp pilus assembly protein PilF